MRLRWKIAQAAEIRWWQRYLRGKSPEAYLQWKINYWNQFLEKCDLSPEEHSLCLDAGCGPAGIFIALDQQKVDAIDPLLDQYQQKLEAFDPTQYPWVNFHHIAMENYTPAHQYDYIFCLNAINHVSDWSASIAKLFDWIKPGGSILLSTDVHRHPWLKPIFRALPGDILHPHQHNLKEYIKEIEKYHPESIKPILIKKEPIFDYYALIIKTSELKNH
jgi:2-polyprenyl-3-methyl-5-hydroxy-6-metoxy-1,4-benzoquinol methylase